VNVLHRLALANAASVLLCDRNFANSCQPPPFSNGDHLLFIGDDVTEVVNL